MLAHQDGEWHLRFHISHETFFRRRFMARDPDFLPYWQSYQENPGKTNYRVAHLVANLG